MERSVGFQIGAKCRSKLERSVGFNMGAKCMFQDICAAVDSESTTAQLGFSLQNI